MISINGKKALLRIIKIGFVVWILFVLIIYFFSGSFKSAYPIGILVLIALVKFVIPDYKKFKREAEEADKKNYVPPKNSI